MTDLNITLNDIIKVIRDLRWHRVPESVGFTLDFSLYRAFLYIPTEPYVPWGSLRDPVEIVLTITDNNNILYRFEGDRLRDLWLWVYEKTKDPPLAIETPKQKQFCNHILRELKA